MEPVQNETTQAPQAQPATAVPVAAPPPSVREWRKRRGQYELHDLTLPSGLPVKARKPNVQAMMFSGHLPYELISELQTFAVKPEGADESSEPSKPTVPVEQVMKNSDKFFGMLDMLFLEAVVYPTVVDDREWGKVQRIEWMAQAPETEVLLSEFSDIDGLGDKSFITTWATQGVEALKKFRPEAS